MIDIPYYDEHHNRLMAEEVLQSSDVGSETVYACIIGGNTSPTYDITEEMLNKKIVFIGQTSISQMTMRFRNATEYNLVFWRLQYFVDGSGFEASDISPNASYNVTSIQDGVMNSLNGIIVFSRYTSVPEA